MSVKPLNSNTAIALLERFDSVRDGTIRAITAHSPTSISIELSTQDANRGFDWINVIFKIDGVSDAKLLDDNLLSSLDMSDGVTIDITPTAAAFAIGSYANRADESTLFIKGTNISYSEIEYRD